MFVTRIYWKYNLFIWEWKNWIFEVIYFFNCMMMIKYIKPLREIYLVNNILCDKINMCMVKLLICILIFIYIY